MSGQRVEPCDCCAVGSDDKSSRYTPADILSGLLLQVSIQRFHATGKSRTIVLNAERLDSVASFLVLLAHKVPSRFL
jgi:hypothetical protein